MPSTFDSTTPHKEPPAWYTDKLSVLDPRMAELLEARGIPPSEALQHVQDVRDRVWSQIKYPCIGDFLFTHFEMPRHRSFPKVLERLRKTDGEDQRLLDMGCGFGQELRNLSSLGIDEDRLIGLDNNPAMLEFGHDLFRDRETFRARFVVADMLDAATFPADLLGSIDIVFAGLSFHLFDLESQIQAVVNAVTLLKPQAGSMVFGWQLGRTEEKDFGSFYIHDVTSFERLWKEVDNRTGRKFKVDAWLDAIPDTSNMLKVDVEFRTLRFEVTQEE